MTPRPPDAMAKSAGWAADASLDDAAAGVLSGCLDSCATHAATLRKGYDSEAVHQLRVALRRLRAFLGVIKDVVSGAERVRLAEQAKEIAGAIGAARDLDVFCEGLGRDAPAFFGDEASFSTLLQAAERRRLEAQEAARTAVAAPSALVFEASLRSFIARRPWRERTPASQAPGSAKDFAAEALRRLRRRAQRRCKGLGKASEAEQHAARIAVKKARYAAELFAGLFGATEARAYARGLAKIQDGLGRMNDEATARRLLDFIVGSDAALADAPAVVLLQERHRRASQNRTATVKHCARRLRRLKPFWSRPTAKSLQEIA